MAPESFTCTPHYYQDKAKPTLPDDLGKECHINLPIQLEAVKGISLPQQILIVGQYI